MLYQLSYASTGCRSPNLKTDIQKLPAARDKVQRLSQRNLTCKRLPDRHFHGFRTVSKRPQLRSITAHVRKQTRLATLKFYPKPAASATLDENLLVFAGLFSQTWRG